MQSKSKNWYYQCIQLIYHKSISNSCKDMKERLAVHIFCDLSHLYSLVHSVINLFFWSCGEIECQTVMKDQPEKRMAECQLMVTLMSWLNKEVVKSFQGEHFIWSLVKIQMTNKVGMIYSTLSHCDCNLATQTWVIMFGPCSKTCCGQVPKGF